MKNIIMLLAFVAFFTTNNAQAKISLGNSEHSKWFNELNIKPDLSANPNFDTKLYASVIKQIEDYINSIVTLSADFYQVTAGKRMLSAGKMYIQRPGKVKWEYRLPKEIMLLINGDDVVYYDRKLDQITYANTPDTPLDILLGTGSKLTDNARILDVKDRGNYRTIVLTGAGKASKFNNQVLALTFKKHPILELSRITRMDETGSVINLQLLNTKLNKRFPEGTFEFKNPRIFKRSRRN